MAEAIPTNVRTLIEAHAMTAHKKHMVAARANAESSNNLMRHIAVRKLDERGVASAAAVSKILALPK